MPEITAYADIFRDWEGLLWACIQKANLIPGLEPMRSDLETVLALARDLKIRQEDLAGSRQATTQLLLQTVDEGRELARKIRSFVKARLGSRSEHLVQFGLIPNRPKSRNKAKQPTPTAPPADGGTTNPSTNPTTPLAPTPPSSTEPAA